MACLALIIKQILKKYIIILKEKENKNLIEGAGTYIGIFERILVFTFVLTNQYAAISIIFAAKSIARFRELDDRDIAEYYLLGTFASITLAVIVGIIFKLLFGDIQI